MDVPVMRGRRSISNPTPPAPDGTAASVSDARLIELYLDMLAAERGAARNTLEAYRRDLEDFAAELKGAVVAATGEDIRGYLARLAGRDLSAATVARRLSAVR